MLYSNRTSFDEPVLKLFDRTYTVAKKLDRFIGNGLLAANMSSCQFIVVPDMEELYELNTLQKQALTDIASDIRTFYGFDTDAGEEEQVEFYRDLCSLFAADGYQATVESKADDRAGFMGLYGGIFFPWRISRVLFLMATVLIIYYKQISEGYDDKGAVCRPAEGGNAPGGDTGFHSFSGVDGIFPAAADGRHSFVCGLSHDIPAFGADEFDQYVVICRLHAGLLPDFCSRVSFSFTC